MRLHVAMSKNINVARLLGCYVATLRGVGNRNTTTDTYDRGCIFSDIHGVCPYRTLETSSDTLITPTVGTLETSSDTLITPTVGTYPRVCPKYHHRHLRSRMYFFGHTRGYVPTKMDTEYRIQFSHELSHRVQGKREK